MRARTLDIDALSHAARRTELRAALNEVLGRGVTLLLLPLVYAAAALTVVKVFHPSPSVERALEWGFVIPAGVFVGGLLRAALRRRPPFRGALSLDRAHDLHDRITNAIEFSRLAESSRTALMEAAIGDALAVARDLSPEKAAPLRVPRDLPFVVAVALATFGIALLEVPIRRVVPAVSSHIDAIAVSPDDADLFRKMGDELAAQTTDPVASAGVRRFNQIVEDLAARRLDRTEVFRRLDDVARSMKDPLGVDPSAIDQAFDGIAKELGKSGLSKPVSDALSAGQLSDAEKAMQDLAKKVAAAKKDVDKARLEALRDSMKKAAETVQHRTESEQAERQSLEETRRRLLEKKNKQGLNGAEQKELERAERQLERLDRERAQNEAQRQALSGVDKDLQKAAQDLMKDLGQSSRDIQQGAQDMNRAAQKQMSEEQKKELLRKIEELRQILRQEGQAGRDRIKRMLAFGQSARGQSGQGENKPNGKGSSSGMGGSGKEGGQGQGNGPGGQDVTISPGAPGPGGGALVMMPGASPGGSEPDPSKGGGGASKGGSEWGTGHDPNLTGDKTSLKGHTEDVSAAGADTGQGAASSQVIYGAAERGFVGRGYKKVYTDYQTVAEEALGRDEIPPGYRFYIRRYFQLIRPRD